MGNFEAFAIRLRELRTKLEKTQKEFAELVGTTSVTISAYENHSKKPSLDIVKDIAEKCNVSIDWLCGLSNKENINNECTTYSDIIKLLLTIDKYLDLSIQFHDYDFTSIGMSGYPEPFTRALASIYFLNDTANEFLTDWNKMRDFYHDGTIDDDVYNLWIEKTLRKYNLELARGKGWDDIPSIEGSFDAIPDATDDEAPFNQ